MWRVTEPVSSTEPRSHSCAVQPNAPEWRRKYTVPESARGRKRAIFGRRTPVLREPLRLLAREDCHLCEIVQRNLDILGVPYEVVDVDQDDLLQEEYGEAIPVLMHGDEEVMRAPIELKELKKALERRKLTGTRR